MTDSQHPSDQDYASGALLNFVEQSKRQSITTACDRCRAKKLKARPSLPFLHEDYSTQAPCDGRRPCDRCKRRKADCVYPRGQQETVHQALKRKYDEISETHDQTAQLLQEIAEGDEHRALDIFRRLRSGQSTESIVRAIGSAGSDIALAATHQRWLQQSFAGMLFHSTAPLDEIVSFATSTFMSKGIRIVIPNAEQRKPLRHRVITLEGLSGIFADANRPKGLPTSTTPTRDEDYSDSDGVYHGPRFFVPATPWTTLLENDEVVSDLISWYLAFVRPCWRAFEEDLFIPAMRSGLLDTEYCSPILVNAILAHASLYSSHKEAFVKPGQYPTRGEHFHEEALRLWALEEGRVSLVNMQALMVLLIECGMRGNTSLMLSLTKTLADMNQSLSMTLARADSQDAARKYARARAVMWWQVNNMQIHCALHLVEQNSTHGLNIDYDKRPDLRRYLVNTTYTWTGYRDMPPQSFDVNGLQVHRCNLYVIAYDILQLLASSEMRLPKDEIWDRAMRIASRLSAWHDNLPPGCRYRRNMPVPQYDLHTCYNVTCMWLYQRTSSLLFGTSTNPTIEPTEDMTSLPPHWKAVLYTKALQYSYRGATITRDFRETYGFKDTAMYMVLYSFVGAFVFLNDMKLNTTCPTPASLDGISIERWTSAAAFEECFRCIAGNGMQLMIARGVARTIASTAQMLGVRLPQNVLRIMHPILETSWRSVDVENIKALYTDQTGRCSDRARDDVTVEGLLARWDKSSMKDEALLSAD